MKNIVKLTTLEIEVLTKFLFEELKNNEILKARQKSLEEELKSIASNQFLNYKFESSKIGKSFLKLENSLKDNNFKLDGWLINIKSAVINSYKDVIKESLELKYDIKPINPNWFTIIKNNIILLNTQKLSLEDIKKEINFILKKEFNY